MFVFGDDIYDECGVMYIKSLLNSFLFCMGYSDWINVYWRQKTIWL